MTPLAELIAERIRRYGPLTFADYMRECLYHPVHGYYSMADAPRFADYYTSVDVHPVFGRLLARQFAEMWDKLRRPEEFTLVETGAGVGSLAMHVLDFCEGKFPAFYEALRYMAVERSAARRTQAAIRLERHSAAGHFASSVEMPAHVPSGCLFSNELMDALPVHRITVESGALKEIFVGFRDGQFVDVTAPLSTCAINEYFAMQRVVLREGQQAEAGLEACDWITEVGRRLERGYVLTVDYGHPAADLFDDHHMRGTLLAYRDHRASEDYYASPGKQDLTAHVNFTALETWGKRSGLETAGFTSQTAFLLALGQGNEFADLYDRGQSESDQIRARLQLKTLIYPEGMGEQFQVLVQRKGVPETPLLGLSGIGTAHLMENSV
ncbi:MAG TPA: SAM-dependent methyltransferase [Candidatus Acidoferrum sp.]|nr:SAM-dependent methyltransferase [Candidatus Acidoferrum sp.]